MEKFFRVWKIQKIPSKYGGICFLILFKDDRKETYKTWIYPKLRNFKFWIKVLNSGKGVLLKNLRTKDGRLIDADSEPIIVKEEVVNLFK